MSNLKTIVDAILKESNGLQAKLLLARVGLKAGVNLSRVGEDFPDNPQLEARVRQAAREVLGRDLLIPPTDFGQYN